LSARRLLLPLALAPFLGVAFWNQLAPLRISPEPAAPSSSAPVPPSSDPAPESSGSAAGRPRREAPKDEGPEEIKDPEEVLGEDAPEPPSVPLPARWQAAVGPETRGKTRVAAAQCARFQQHGVREVHTKEDFDIVFDPPAQAAMRRCKEAVIAALEARAAEAAAIAGDEALPGDLTPFFRRPLVESGLRPGEGGGHQAEDLLLSFSVTAVTGTPLLGIIFGVPITGGDDESLVLFEHRGRKMTTVMVVAKHDYASITEGQLDLSFAARPVEGGYHVGTVNGSPWISSMWRGAHLKIFASSTTPARPTLLLERHNGARGPAGVVATPSGFQARFASWTTFRDLTGDVVRTHVQTFARDGASYRRVAPFAARVRELPDEWVRLPWGEAAELTVPEERERLAPIHGRLAAMNKASTLPGALRVYPRSARALVAPGPEPRFFLSGEGDQARIADVQVEEPAPAPAEP
jgi:hypothetical protein